MTHAACGVYIGCGERSSPSRVFTVFIGNGAAGYHPCFLSGCHPLGPPVVLVVDMAWKVPAGDAPSSCYGSAARCSNDAGGCISTCSAQGSGHSPHWWGASAVARQWYNCTCLLWQRGQPHCPSYVQWSRLGKGGWRWCPSPANAETWTPYAISTQEAAQLSQTQDSSAPPATSGWPSRPTRGTTCGGWGAQWPTPWNQLGCAGICVPRWSSGCWSSIGRTGGTACRGWGVFQCGWGCHSTTDSFPAAQILGQVALEVVVEAPDWTFPPAPKLGRMFRAKIIIRVGITFSCPITYTF